ncbi:MAG: hypothetical protein JWL90_4148, partial [Chthoniobacteraceae bacterium]|nr:hypothetical protein [Chthoniobacteraceae bacterium]
GDSISINQGVAPISGAVGSVTVLPSAATTYILTDATSGTTAQVILTPGALPQLTHRWSFNEGSGTLVTDSVGTANGAIVGNGSTRSATQIVLPGGSSASAPYIDLPNGLISSLNQLTIEGWMTITGSQSWSRVFDFGTGSSGEIFAPGGTPSGTEYLLLSAQIGGDQNTKRLAIKDNNVENSVDLNNPVTNGQQFHFVVVYDAAGNNGSPQVRYYRDGILVGALNTAFRLQNIVDVNNWLGRSQFNNDLNTAGSYNEFRIWNAPLGASYLADAAATPDTLPLDSFTAFPSLTVYRGSTARLSYLLGNPSAGALTASIDQGVGPLTGSSGFVSVTPTATTTYTLTVNNGGVTRLSSVKLTVIAGDPVAGNLTIAAGYQTATPIVLAATDPNTPANQITYIIVTPPAHGTLSGSGANLTYTPANGYSGPDGFNYKANDGLTDSNTAAVTITVLAAPAAPTDITLSENALSTSYAIASFAGRIQAVDVNAEDRFTFSLVDGEGAMNNAFFTINGNQLITAHDFSGDINQVISIRVRVSDSTGRSVEKVITRTVLAPKLHVKINEVNYNPSRNTQLSEFIELYNPFDTAVSLGGWYFSKGVAYTFPPGATIAPRGYLVIASDPSTIQALYGVTALGPWTGGLSSDGDSIVLKDNSGLEVDHLDYGITAPWPVAPNGDGPSLELINPDLDNDLGGHWRASTVTPAFANYITGRSTGWHYRPGTSEASTPIGSWRDEAFIEDATWVTTGTMPIGLYKKNSNVSVASITETGVTLGTQLTGMATFNGSSFVPAYTTVFFRKTFTAAATIPRAVLLRVMHNDAAIVWINGTEVGRFGFPPGVNGDVAFNANNYYERGNDPWSEVVLLNAGNVIHPGINTIAIQGFAKLPVQRADQDSPADYNIFDFSIDAELRNPPELLGTPGGPNSVLAANASPAIRDVNHSPAAPKSSQPITVTARISDEQGVGAVQLLYQTCAPGGFIPASLPLTNAQLLAAVPDLLPANPAFEAAANWTVVMMVDDGSVAGDVPGDGIFTGRIPAQPHRTLVRYRVMASDLAGTSVRVPAVDDPRKNYACYVYNGVPDYVANGQVYAAGTLNTLPVYQWITRASDFSSLLSYNGAEQLANSIDLNVLLARRFENFEGALVVGDQVVDHTHVRLRGGNSRYAGSGKRHFRFKFPKGDPLDARDEQGRAYPRPWEEMLFNKMFGNKGYYDWGLPYEAAGRVWRLLGIPIPESHWVHFRVVRNAAEAPDAVNGDFWGLYQALELPEGKNFLKARNLPLGNFFKMSDWTQNSEMDERYQAKGAPDFGEDFDNIRYNVHQKATDTFIKTYVNMPLWYRYNAVQEAIRHYDIFTEPTGRHRVKNLLWYFEPKANTGGLGYLWFMPYDWDASFGPNFNNGWDLVHNALYDHNDFADSPTWVGSKLTPRTTMAIEHRNAIRELRDLIWYRETGTNRGPFDDILDDAAATLAPFWPVDRARWPITGAVADHSGGMPFKVQDMKNFAFTGWTDTTGSGDPAIGAGGRAAYLDAISDNLDAGQLPVKPSITYTGAAGFPSDGIKLQSSLFSDPQGVPSFGAMQWRVGEVTDPNAPAFDPTALRIYEVTSVWESGELSAFNASITVPGNVLRAGHAYRARVRHRDTTGRWSHWSAPLVFTAGISDYTQVLHDNLVVSEVMYHPLAPAPNEAALGYTENDFEYIELRNVSTTLTLDLGNVRLTKGADFNFAGSSITNLAPGAVVLIVKNSAAFAFRYGAGKPVAGAWDSANNLSNGGEEIKVSYGAGTAIQDFVYDDEAPWPTVADTGGYSLVLVNPESRPDPALAKSWRASYVPGGTPGADDRTTFASWRAAHSGTDFDGIEDLLEYALGGNPALSDRAILPQAAIQPLIVNGVPGQYLTLTFRRMLGAEDIIYNVLWSPNLSGGWSASGALVSSTDRGDGSVTEVWRAPQPVGVGNYFGQLRVTKP